MTITKQEDYGNLFDFDEYTVIPLIDQVKEFLAEIKRFVEN